MMNKETDKLKAENITFYTAARQNTGGSIADTGDVYGRHYDRIEVTPDDPCITWEDPEEPATLSTPHLLDSCLEIDRDVQKEWEDWDKVKGVQDDLDDMESAVEFLKEMSGNPRSRLYQYVSRARDNVYNMDNDLPQVFIWDVWTRDPGNEDWLYAEESITLIHIHTGCDVRGGYSRPLFCRKREEYPMPIDVTAGYSIVDSLGTFPDGILDLDEHWWHGYSPCPYVELEKDITQWLCPGTVPVSHIGQHRDGPVLEIKAQTPCEMSAYFDQ